ncbi:hypothetical protein SAMD00020551_4991 [Mesobacillus selenatarsenatis SF-1]|uniref:Uncharacterized protein n=1 Tax=Mesobacillus selenatarsenatis (strain DSM 18680 / JCM 14380 / FERM P-15431 / SF-1) TaxID=1321606 RepID=A0A0A8XF46_MESS1|nr:hypothetical protein SAMD00020551_4991 [Mesobacillus selenatarsenatis SF-1]
MSIEAKINIIKGIYTFSPHAEVCTIPEAGIMNKGVNGKKGHSKNCGKMLEWCYCLKMFEDWWT